MTFILSEYLNSPPNLSTVAFLKFPNFTAFLPAIRRYGNDFACDVSFSISFVILIHGFVYETLLR